MWINKRKISNLRGKFDNAGSLYDLLRDRAILLLNNPEIDGKKQILEIQELIEKRKEIREKLRIEYLLYERDTERTESQTKRDFESLRKQFEKFEIENTKREERIEKFCNSPRKQENIDAKRCVGYLKTYVQYYDIDKKAKEIEDSPLTASPEESRIGELGRLLEEKIKIQSRLSNFFEKIEEIRGRDKEEVKLILDELKSDFENVEDRQGLLSLCKRTFEDSEELETGCRTYLGEYRNLKEIEERVKLIDAIPSGSNVIIKNDGLPENSSLKGVISNFRYFYFTDSKDFYGFIKNKLIELGISKDDISNIRNLRNKLINLIKNPESLPTYKGKRSYKSVIAEYIAAIDFISQNRDSRIIFPCNPNQAYFDFISYDGDGNTTVFPVKTGKENNLGIGREADTSGLLRLIGELPKRILNENEEEYQTRLKEKLERLIKENNPKLRKLIDNSKLSIVHNDGQVSFIPDIKIEPFGNVMGTRTKDGIRETTHKYRITRANKSQKDNFSSSVQKAVHLLKSPSFSEAGFKKFMHENKLWQAI